MKYRDTELSEDQWSCHFQLTQTGHQHRPRLTVAVFVRHFISSLTLSSSLYLGIVVEDFYKISILKDTLARNQKNSGFCSRDHYRFSSSLQIDNNLLEELKSRLRKILLCVRLAVLISSEEVITVLTQH